MNTQDYYERLSIIDEITRLVKVDRSEIKRTMELSDDVLDIFENLNESQRIRLAMNFHNIFILNKKVLTEALRDIKQSH